MPSCHRMLVPGMRKPLSKLGSEAARLLVDWRSPRFPGSLEMAVTQLDAWRVGEGYEGVGCDAAQVSFPPSGTT